MDKAFSYKKLVILHLYPGLLILGLYLLLAPLFKDLGFPSLFSLMISFLLVIIPFELGYLIKMAKLNGDKWYSLKGILTNKTLQRKKFIGLIVSGIVASILVAGITQLVDTSIKENIFAWLPDWYVFDEEYKKGYTKQALLITAILRVFVDGLIIPFTEEVYFRGYLLPRIQAKGLWTPILASVLFAIYHFWQPWNYVSLLIISAVLVFPAWYFKNYKISLYIHLILNLIGAILFLLMII